MTLKIDKDTELACLYCSNKFLASSENVLVNADGEYVLCPKCGKYTDIQQYYMPALQLLDFYHFVSNMKKMEKENPEKYNSLIDWVKNNKKEEIEEIKKNLDRLGNN